MKQKLNTLSYLSKDCIDGLVGRSWSSPPLRFWFLTDDATMFWCFWRKLLLGVIMTDWKLLLSSVDSSRFMSDLIIASNVLLSANRTLFFENVSSAPSALSGGSTFEAAISDFSCAFSSLLDVLEELAPGASGITALCQKRCHDDLFNFHIKFKEFWALRTCARIETKLYYVPF